MLILTSFEKSALYKGNFYSLLLIVGVCSEFTSINFKLKTIPIVADALESARADEREKTMFVREVDGTCEPR